MRALGTKAAVAALALLLAGCSHIRTGSDFAYSGAQAAQNPAENVTGDQTPSVTNAAENVTGDQTPSVTNAAENVTGDQTPSVTNAAENVTGGQTPSVTSAPSVTSEAVSFDPSWLYAANSKISSGTAVLYRAAQASARGYTVCVNAGHGTRGGTEVKTLCHPDGSPKVTGGTTESGATEAVAVSTGTEMLDGTPEAAVTLSLALLVKQRLLDAGFDVLMIRETDDVQLDNVARTVMANNRADCHIALHYDSTDFDKGVFFMSVPSDPSYRSMEPVASHCEEHNAFGRAVVQGVELAGFSLFEGGEMEMDLTQTSYSTIPSIDLEVGDRASDYSEAVQSRLAEGIAMGVVLYYQSHA